MKWTNIVPLPWLVAAMGTLFVFDGAPAHAYWRAMPGAACFVANTESHEQGTLLPTGAMRARPQNDPPPNVVESSNVLCAVEDTSEHPYATASFVQLYVHDAHASASVSARACVSTYEVLGTFCGSAASTSGTGWRTLRPSLGQWVNRPDGFAYVTVSLPREPLTLVQTPSQLSGIWVVFP
jgi:hypothetical protein